MRNLSYLDGGFSYLPAFFNHMSGLQKVLGSHGDVVVLVGRVQLAVPTYLLRPGIEQQKSVIFKDSPSLRSGLFRVKTNRNQTVKSVRRFA